MVVCRCPAGSALRIAPAIVLVLPHLLAAGEVATFLDPLGWFRCFGRSRRNRYDCGVFPIKALANAQHKALPTSRYRQHRELVDILH